MSNISVENAFAKYGQSQIEFNSMKELWKAGEYEKAGESAAEGLMTLTEYQIPQHIQTHYHFWPWSLMQPIGGSLDAQRAADITSGLMIGLVDRENFDNMTGCFTDAEVYNDQIDQVLTLLETKKNENIAKAVQKLADTVYTLPDKLSNCEKSQSDIDALTAWADSLPSSGKGEFELTILHSLKDNKSEIGLNIAKASAQDIRAEFFEFGHTIGHLANLLTTH